MMLAGKTLERKEAVVLLVVANNQMRTHQDHFAGQRAY
jgi:hypothetical protein